MSPKLKFAFTGFISTLLFSSILFLTAGRVSYIQGWIYAFTNIATTILNILTIRIDLDLMNERMKPGEGAKDWDKLLLGLLFLVFLSTIIIAGLDSGRYRLTPDLHWSLYCLGILLTVTGQLIFVAARNENTFFSTVVRIQTDRGHAVCDSGLYKIVRHPGYAGMMISTIGLPLILGSLWSVIPSLISILLMTIRTHLEDRTLIHELHGYQEYAGRTRYRLVPGIW